MTSAESIQYDPFSAGGKLQPSLSYVGNIILFYFSEVEPKYRYALQLSLLIYEL
jgi:hypothetical protein